jgi:hypothetical protein
MGFISTCAGIRQASACSACARPISPPCAVTNEFNDMFCALKGATFTPRRESNRHRPATITLLPTSDPVPKTAIALACLLTVPMSQGGASVPCLPTHGCQTLLAKAILKLLSDPRELRLAQLDLATPAHRWITGKICPAVAAILLHRSCSNCTHHYNQTDPVRIKTGPFSPRPEISFHPPLPAAAKTAPFPLGQISLPPPDYRRNLRHSCHIPFASVLVYP